jgi:hypothetical protein
MAEKSTYSETGSAPNRDSVESPGGRFDRISAQTKGLVDDVKEWVDLRVRLVQLDLEDRIDVIANQTILTLIIIGIGGASMLFGLFAAAFGLGILLGNNALGFLSISVLLGLATLMMNFVRPRFINNALLNVAKRGQSVATKDVQEQLKSDERALNPQLPEARTEAEN